MAEIFSNSTQTIDMIALFASTTTVLGVVAALYLMISDR